MPFTENSQHPELLAPAGGWDCLRAAVANGADAVYFGLPRFNARMRADNFRDDELVEVVRFCHRHGVKAYVAFNTLVFTSELDAAEKMLRDCSRAGVDALIVQDIGIVRLARAIVPDLPLHASTQMTITSPEGIAFAKELGIQRVVLARELSLRELEKFSPDAPATDAQHATRHPALPLEVFVHGALCVAYSGQCLTSESLGQRSANRGECAQACRMPYELIVDGAVRDLGDKKYLLSPQDLAAAEEIPALLARGVTSFKIEGRLKSPEYVAAVCQVYRKALDAALAAVAATPSSSRYIGISVAPPPRVSPLAATDRYQLEMTFSRGLFTGWMHGVDHQRLVSARFGKKRGPLAGRIVRVGHDHIELAPEIELKPGDGIVFDTGGDTNAEQGGRIYEIRGQRYFFEHGKIDFTALRPGDRVWKTDDPSLNKRLQQSYAAKLEPRRRIPLTLTVRGAAGEPLEVEAHGCIARSTIPLQTARTAPLTDDRLREHLGRFGEHPYALAELRNELAGEVILPIGELNRIRRELAFALDAALERQREESPQTWRDIFAETAPKSEICMAVLVRTMDQLEAALACGVTTLYADFEDIRRYKDAVARVKAAIIAPCDAAAHARAEIVGRDSTSARIGGAGVTRSDDGYYPALILATPRIQKAGESGFFKLIEAAAPDGVLIRNLGAIDFFARTPLRCIGDFSLNVANPLTAQHFLARGLERVTLSYDLNIEQVLDLLAGCDAKSGIASSSFELTLHQHMPMFHMEHCVFAAFMSKGSTALDCGRPCEKHRVHLRDRVGIEHPLRADVGCRNTLFNAVPQTGARFFDALRDAGLGYFRIELLEEDAAESMRVIRAYQSLLSGERGGDDLWRDLKAQSQLGVTRGTLG